MTYRKSNEDATAHAAELAEQILDEVSKSDQSWRTIERCARELAELATQAVQRATASSPDR
jgi:hypothetical protein